VSYTYQVLVSTDVTGLITLGGLARQSIEVCLIPFSHVLRYILTKMLQGSTLSKDTKAVALAAWERQWAIFIHKIIDGSLLS
jgi:hypothetical protein